MSKQYIVVEKEGQKWLRIEGAKNYFTAGLVAAGNSVLKESPDLPYMGSHPVGTKLDENQIQQTVSWEIPVGEVSYTDAEYPGIKYQPLFDHMSKNHGLTLTTSEMDEIIALSAYILK